MASAKIKVLAKSHHRNGISGQPFDVYIFDDPDYGPMLGVDWGDEGSGIGFAVFVISRLAEGDIAFGSNSWRGDYYADTVRNAGEKIKEDVSPDALMFVKYKVSKKEHKNGRKSTAGN